MTTTRNLNPTLADLMSRVGPNGELADIVEVLNETNEMLDDIAWVEANNKFTHKTTVRSGLPSATWRKLNYGVKPSKSQTKQIVDSCGMLEAFAVVDKKLAEINKMSESWRVSENAPFIEAMNQEFQRALIFGDSSKDPEKIMGLAPRFNTVSTAKAASAANVIDAGGTGNDLTSIWLVCWSPNTVHCIYPEGSQAGLKEEDLGEQTERDEDGGKYQALASHYSWDVGLTVRDWRYVVRIANVKKSMLDLRDPNAEDKINLIELMIRAIERLPNARAGRLAFYCNRDIATAIRLQRLNTKNVNITQKEVAGYLVTEFDGVPVRRVDALEWKEAQVK